MGFTKDDRTERHPSERNRGPAGEATFTVRCVASMTLVRPSLLGRFGLRLGAALILSDLVHHYAILWPIVGSPQFDLTYPI